MSGACECANCGLRYVQTVEHRTLGTVCPWCFGPVPARPRRNKGVKASVRRRVADRDMWQCHICKGLVEPRATGVAAPSADHVIPVSAGGTNDLENLRLAHAGCNNLRGSAPVGSTQRAEARKRAAS